MQHILGQVRRCVEDYHMIEAGDKVAVGVSGGKDSLLTLTALARLREFYPIPFQVEAITLETGTPGMSFDAVAELCRELEVPYTRIHVPVYRHMDTGVRDLQFPAQLRHGVKAHARRAGLQRDGLHLKGDGVKLPQPGQSRQGQQAVLAAGDAHGHLVPGLDHVIVLHAAADLS